MAGSNTFNTTAGQQISRDLLVAYLNTGTYASPTWSAIGTYVEDSSVEYDWSEETTQDVLGNTHSTMKKPIVTQTFDGVKLYQGDPAYEKIFKDGIKSHDAQALCNLDMMIAHLYADFAERYPSSMVRPTSIGGEGGGSIEMPFEATYGGARELGTFSKDKDTGAVTFTKAA